MHWIIEEQIAEGDKVDDALYVDRLPAGGFYGYTCHRKTGEGEGRGH